ncbi:MAG: hypothetical protein IJD86_01115, partial [Clostridia bacterium]|nr:hypothetical protein [Clostridia bacterium]
MSFAGFEKLYTKEGESLSEKIWNVYPRPQMKRNSFYSVNGTWDIGCGFEKVYDEKIRVPFAP